MKKNDPIRNLMTANPVTVYTEQKPSEVQKILANGGFNHVPVTHAGKLVGIVSSSDILRIIPGSWGSDEREIAALIDHKFTVESIMQRDVKSLNVSGVVRDAAEILSAGDFHALPVVDDDGMLVGIVTSTDLIRYLVEQY